VEHSKVRLWASPDWQASNDHGNRFAGGKSVEHWLNIDTLGLLQQLAMIPVPEQSA